MDSAKTAGYRFLPAVSRGAFGLRAPERFQWTNDPSNITSTQYNNAHKDFVPPTVYGPKLQLRGPNS